MKGRLNCIKWITKSIYVDVGTGEIIPKHIAINKYTITNKSKTYYVTDKTGTTTFTNECKRNTSEQLTLF